MPTVDLVINSPGARSIRARQVCSMFDVPPEDGRTLEWHGDVPIEAEPWSVGLIVGPSGSGKTQIARKLFGDAVDRPVVWTDRSIIEDFPSDISVAEISETLGSVGFNTIPAWLRPHAVLSNGEKFRADVARRLCDTSGLIVIDEFTSVVDRQVAQVASHAIQKRVRATGRQLVAVSCHFDVIDWLQPDWILEPAGMKFSRRLLRRRPAVEVEIRRVSYDLWSLFAPFHYLTAKLSKSCRCFAMFVEGRPVAFAGIGPFPHPKVRDIRQLSRLVTLPDYQGLGFGPMLSEKMGAIYRALNLRLRYYPAHPALIRTYEKAPYARLVRAAGQVENSSRANKVHRAQRDLAEGRAIRPYGIDTVGTGRPCATFEYCGAAHASLDEARAVYDGVPLVVTGR